MEHTRDEYSEPTERIGAMWRVPRTLLLGAGYLPGGCLRSYRGIATSSVSSGASETGADLDANRCAPIKSTKALTLGDK